MNTKVTDKKIQLSNIKLSINDENNEANDPVPAPGITKPDNVSDVDSEKNNKQKEKKNLKVDLQAEKKLQLSDIKLSINDENSEANGPVPAPDITKPGNNENNDDYNNNKKNQK